MNENPAIHNSTVVDISGWNNNGVFITNDGSANKSVSGVINNALSFDGVDDYVSQPATLGSAGTVCFWLDPEYAAGARPEYFFASSESANNFFTLQNWNYGNTYWG